jgi:hypothetical protein
MGQVVDHGFATELRDGLSRHARKVRVIGTGTGRACRDQGERGNAAGMIERHELADRPAHRHPHEMDYSQVEGFEQACRIRGQVPHRVAGSAGRVGDRSPGVPVVISDYKAVTCRKPFAELILPPVHRGT